MAEAVLEVLIVGMGDLVMAVELGVVVEATVERIMVTVERLMMASTVEEVMMKAIVDITVETTMRTTVMIT